MPGPELYDGGADRARDHGLGGVASVGQWVAALPGPDVEGPHPGRRGLPCRSLNPPPGRVNAQGPSFVTAIPLGETSAVRRCPAGGFSRETRYRENGLRPWVIHILDVDDLSRGPCSGPATPRELWADKT